MADLPFPVPPVAGVAAPPPRPWVLLLVDDEPDILSSFKTIIETCIPGTKVITSTTGRKAIDILDSTPVDAIIADFKMPGMDGIELLYLARKLHPSVPRIMLTAFADDDLIRRAIADAFVDEFIPKMVQPADFLKRITRFLELSHLDPQPVALAPTRPPPPAADARSRT